MVEAMKQKISLGHVHSDYRKGTEIGTVLLPSMRLVRFFNPRTDKWNEHFEVSGALVLPKTDIAEGTIKIFHFNQIDRLLERKTLVNAGLYPPPPSLQPN